MSDVLSCSHASHEACELKSNKIPAYDKYTTCHASHEACELKFIVRNELFSVYGHASHEACELKCPFDFSH